MHEAYSYAGQMHDTPLYEEIFFRRKTKFQYAPTALLFVPLFERLMPDHTWGRPLTGKARYVSWGFVLMTLLFSFLILRSGLKRKGLCAAAFLSADTAALLFTVTALTILFFPVVRSYELGQIQTWINGLIAASILFWMRGKPWAAGILTGLVCLMKPTYGLVVLWGAVRRQGRFLAGAGATLLTGLVLSIRLFGLENHLDYLRVLSYLSKHGEGFFPNQSMNGLLNRLMMNGTNLEWEYHAFAPFHPAVYWGSLASSLLLVGFLLFGQAARTVASIKNGASIRNAQSTALEFALAILTATMASPIAWEHHYGILLPIYALALPYCLGQQKSDGRLLLGLGISYLLTANFFAAAQITASVPGLNLLQSYLYFGALILLALLYRILPLAAAKEPSP